MVWICRKILIGFQVGGGATPLEDGPNDLWLAGLQQIAAILKQAIDAREVIKLAGINLRDHSRLQLQGAEALLETHQTLGKGANGLGKILGSTRDPKGQGVGGHDRNADLGR